MSHSARGSIQRGGGAPSNDGDLTAESIVGAAIPTRRNAGRIPNSVGPLLRRIRRPMRSMGIDDKTNSASRRLVAALRTPNRSEAAA
jgi:hypothetical protein